MKKFVSLFLAVLMALSLSVTAFAADITINSNVNTPGLSVDGKTFNAYKVLDLVDADGKIYAAAAGMEDFFAARYTLDKADTYFNEQLTAALKNETENTEFDGFAFAAELLAAAKAAGVTPTSAVGASGTAVISGLAAGYYVVEDAGKTGDADTAISALMLQTSDDSPAITIKGSMPGITKDIQTSDVAPEDAGAVDEKKPFNNGSIGELVPYILSSSVPTNMDGYDAYKYIIKDEMCKGLTFNADSVVVKLDGKTLTKGTDYTLTVQNNIDSQDNEYDGGTYFEIEILNFLQYKDNAGDAIEVTYNATINADAVIGAVLGNPNRVRLEYSNNPNYIQQPDDPENPPENPPVGPTGTTPWDDTRTYVTEVQIVKTDAHGNWLAGAEFKLTGERVVNVVVETLVFEEAADGTYWLLNDGTYTTTDPAGEGVDSSLYADTTKRYAKVVKSQLIEQAQDVEYKGVTNEDGVLIFSGLGSGNYTLTETKAPDGYNQLKKPVELTINWSAPSGTSKDCEWSYTWTNAEGSGNVVTIVNNIGVVLPETGGMGTTLFYIAGGVLVVAAVVLLITKKRMGRDE